ncbi:MAG: class I SAM-dependent methyltransferase [Acidobacteria bacterium]|nr:class I SAM-dependent methyltransferase [Acidobacteriota bacterium]
MSRGYTPITDALFDYVRAVSVREPEPLKQQRLDTDSHPRASMQVAPEQGQFLHLLVRMVGAKKVLEVGTFLGYSSAWMALALPPDGRIVACDLSEEFTSRARRTWQDAGVAGKIELRLGPALDTLDSLIAAGEAGTFDFAFIDADKVNYANYYERALVLLRQGGVIAADNVLWDGYVIDETDRTADTEALRAFNLKLHADPRVAMSLVTLGDGLMVACKL